MEQTIDLPAIIKGGKIVRPARVTKAKRAKYDANLDSLAKQVVGEQNAAWRMAMADCPGGSEALQFNRQTWKAIQKMFLDMACRVAALEVRQNHRCVELEKRASELDSKAFNLADSFRGIWEQGENYTRGELATHQGSTWLATKDTSAKPGGPDSGWRLIVKRGRQAKDLREGT